ncbi:von Willebrand factor type A domain protein [Ostertagia ostertagi]
MQPQPGLLNAHAVGNAPRTVNVAAGKRHLYAKASPGALPTTANAMPTIANARPTIANARPTIANARPTIANARPTIANAMPTIANAIPTMANAIDSDVVLNAKSTVTEILNPNPAVSEVLVNSNTVVSNDAANMVEVTLFPNTSIPPAPTVSGQVVAEKESKESEPIESLSDECPCTPANIWLDVFFIIDSSSAMTSSGFDCAMAFVESALFRMTVGQAMGQQTRVGFITYGADAEMHFNLSYWKSTNELLNKLDLTYHGSTGTNIEAAIRLATANFNSVNHRPNARKVIVIIASAFE